MNGENAMLSELLLRWETELAGIQGLRLSKFEDSIIPLTFVLSDGTVYNIGKSGWNCKQGNESLTYIWKIVTDIQHEIIRIYFGNCYLGYSFFSVKKLSNRNLSERYSSLILDFPSLLFVNERQAIDTITNSLKTIKTPSESFGNTDCCILVLWRCSSVKDNKVFKKFSSINWCKTYFGELISDSTKPIWAAFGGDQYRFVFDKASFSDIGCSFSSKELEDYLSYWFSILLHNVSTKKYIAGGFIFHPASVKEEVLTSISIPFAFQSEDEINLFYSNFSKLNISLHAFAAPLERRLRILQFAEKRDILNTRTAIGSIMSRNGSHNIGSHVLSALSHNVGTMPDDRVLYQYIQHRMDYIATATTDFPTWYQPTMFVGEIMRNFFIQKHLLDHIAESEGLHAFYFQGNDQKANDNGAICISVRRLMADAFDSKECVLRPEHKIKQNFVVYNNDHSGQQVRTVFEDDVQLAIPAGVVGNHAVYTIIENVLRNAAKHGKSDDGSNLEIAIGFINDEDKEYAEFFIWNKSLKESGIDVENLVNDIRVRMQEPFIDKDGQLRREDWGLAEMKISAGILQRRSISEIGGLEHVGMDHVKDSEWGDREIISPIRVEGENGAFHFGYSFFVPKPKEFLFVFSEAVKIPGWIILLLRKNGIYLADGFSRDGNGFTSYNLIEISDNDNSQTTHKVEAAYNFSFVVLPQDAIDDVFIKSDSFPFRLMVWKVGEASKKNGQSKLIWRRDDDTQSLIPEFVEQCEAITALTALQTDCSGGVSIAIAAIKDRVYKKWLEYLESKTRDAGLRKVRRELKVLVNVDGNDHTRGSGRSLISDVDIWKFVFKNLFRTTLRTFCSQHAELAERIAPTIYALSMMNVDIESAGIDPRDDDKQTYNIKKVKELLSRPISASIKEQVRKSLSSMWLYLGFLNVLDADQEELSYVLSKLKMIDNTSEEVQFIEHTSVLDDVKDRFKDLANKYSVARIKEDLPFSDGFDTLKKYFKDHFKCQGPEMEVPSLNASASVDMSNAQTPDILLKLLLAAYHAADVMLRKYSEQIATLPLIYTAADGNVGEAGADVEQFKERIGVDACLDATRTNLPILYYRHGTNAACSIYNEGLSGSQSCMMQMQAFVRKPNAEFLFQLTESALMRVLIVDERFSQFLCKRKENAKKLSWMNIWSVNTDVLLDPKVTALQMDVDVSHRTEAPLKISMDLLGKGEIPHGKFDILIVHQGIIDKMLGNASPDEVNTVLENLKKSVPYVVVTTGRGIPANIPPVARVLPFSSIERYLFQEYPEKLLLVNAVMSLLPCGRRR